MLHAGLNPLLTCQNVIYGGDTEGGRGYYVRDPPMPLSRGGSKVLITLFSVVDRHDSGVIYLMIYLVVSFIIPIFVLTMRDRVGFGGR